MLLRVLGILADLLGIFSLWGIGSESPLWLRILFTTIFVMFAVLVCLKDSYIAKVVDYYWSDDTQPTLFIKKNKYFKDNALVSVYMKEDNNTTLSGIGFVINENENYFQIKVLKLMNGNSMHKIKINKKNYKKFYVKPDIRYSDICGIVF